MPKNKNSKKRGGGKGQHQDGAAPPLPRPSRTDEDDESMADNWSTQSVVSDDSSWPGSDPVVNGEEAEEATEQENFEDSFLDCLDNTMQKSSQSRIKALQELQKALQKKYFADFLMERKETVTDHFWRCLRKGKDQEQALAASCLALLAIQLGPEAEMMFEQVHSFLVTVLSDNSVSSQTRGSCMSALAIIAFFCCDDIEKTKSFTKALEEVFSYGYGQGENSPGVSEAMSSLMSEALSAWCLFLTVAPQYEVKAQIDNHLGPLQNLLQSSDVDLRMAAGEAIALIYELARDLDEDFEHDDEVALCELLKQLSKDSVKYRAKKDRRQQRSCFRDVQRFVVENESPTESVKIGKENLLEMSSWSQKRQYTSLCQCLRSGTSVHLKSNPILRDLFELGSPGQDEYGQGRILSKAQRTFNNAAAFKARTKIRSKQRDKRSVTANGF